ncbi:unnamed protein product [Boreogadus saida]
MKTAYCETVLSLLCETCPYLNPAFFSNSWDTSGIWKHLLCVCVRLHACLSLSACPSMRVSVNMCECLCACLRVCVCVCVCVCACVPACARVRTLCLVHCFTKIQFTENIDEYSSNADGPGLGMFDGHGVFHAVMLN